MADHEELVAEMEDVCRMSIQERLHLAKGRRAEQLKRYEGQWTVTADSRSRRRNSDTNQNEEEEEDQKGVRFDNKTRLFEAANRNDLEEVRQLLKSRACQPNTMNEDGFTILHQCCIDGHENLIRSLIQDFGASVNIPDNELWTPLHTVALCGRPHISKLLIDHGADLLALNIDGNMPYDICEDEETLDVIEMEMSSRGVTQNQIEDLRMTKERQMLRDLEQISREDGDLERRGSHGETPLHVAAANGYATVARYLLAAKVTVDAEDDDHWQPIHCAAKWRQLPILELLVTNGAKLTSATEDGRTPLDLCDDPEIQTWLTELKQDLESNRKAAAAAEAASSSLATSHQRLLDIIASKTSLQPTSGSSTLYSSNVSLAAEGNKASSSNRRLTSMEKEMVTRKASQEEAKLRLSLQSLKAAHDDDEDHRTSSDAPVDGLEPETIHTSVTHRSATPDRQTTSNAQDRNGNMVTKTDSAAGSVRDSDPSTNGRIVSNGHASEQQQPKSCLKTPRTKPVNGDDPVVACSNNERTRSRWRVECCSLS